MTNHRKKLEEIVRRINQPYSREEERMDAQNLDFWVDQLEQYIDQVVEEKVEEERERILTKLKKIHKKIHKIGKHGAVVLVTQQGDICAECHKKVKTIL